MNKYVKARLFITPLTVFPVAKPDSMGDVATKAPINMFGYVVESEQNIIGPDGVKVISTRQIYLADAQIDAVEDTYKVSCLTSVKARILKRTVFRGPGGKVLIGVLYIP